MSGNLGALNILLALNTASFQTALQKSNYQVKVFTNQSVKNLNEVRVHIDQLGTRFSYIKNLLSSPHAVLGGFLSAHAIVKTVDAYGQYSSRLKQATADTAEFKAIQAQLLETSNRTYKSYEDATELFIRTSDSLKQLGYDAQAAADLVSTVQFGLTVDSADAQRTKSVIDAISKSILTGKMNMAQFNTVVASSPSLFQALADSIAGGSQQALRQMVADGKLTANELLKVTQQMEELGKRADDMPTTVADAIIKIQNNFAKLTGEINQSFGVTETLAGGLSKLADNLDVVGAAASGFAAVYLSKKGWEGVSIVAQAIRDSSELLKQKMLEAIENKKLAATNVQLALAELNAAQGTMAAQSASVNLTQARFKEQQATKLAEQAQKAYAASLTMTGRALSLVGGPIGLLTLAVTAGSAAWAYYSRDTDIAKQSILDVTRPVAELKNEFLKLGRAQQSVVIADLEAKVKEKTEPAEKALRNLTNVLTDGKVQWQAREIRTLIDSELKGIVADTTLTAQELDQKILEIFESWKTRKSSYSGKALFSDEELDSLDKLVGKFVNAQGEVNVLHQKINELKGSAENVKNEFKNLSAYLVPQGMEKWDEYLKKLTNIRDIIGMNARELAKYRAVQEGANEVQAEMAGIIGAQEDAYRELQRAIQSKDQKAIEAAKNNIAALDIERQKAALLAEQMAAIMSAANDFASGKLSQDMYIGVVNRINEGFAKRNAELQQSKESQHQIQRILNNTVVTGTSNKRSGGGQFELQSLTKSLQEQVAVLGMTELEIQKYKISLMQGSEAAKAYAMSLAEQISRYKEEAETLKQNRALLEEIAVFKDKTLLPLDMMGMGDRYREQMNNLLSIQEEFAQKRRQLEENQESESTRISDEAYKVRMEKLIEAENAKLAILEESFKKRQELESNWMLGAAEALNNYAAEANNVYASMGNAVGNAFKGMEDALVDFVMTGKANFKDLANSIIKDLMRIFIQQQITGLFANALGGIFGGGAAKLGAPTASWSYGTFATGGYVTGPGTGTSDSIPAMLSNGEYVINARATKQNYWLLEAINQGKLPIFRAAGGVVGQVPNVPALQGLGTQQPTQVVVNITNKSSQPVSGDAKFSMDDMGNQVLDIVIHDIDRNGRLGQRLKAMR